MIIALAAARARRALALDPPAVVVKISQRAQIHIVLAAQLFFEPLDFRRLVTGLARFLF